MSTVNSGDTAWLLTASAMVLLMTVPALAMFYGGMVKRRNILSTMYHSVSSGIVVSLLWVIGVYSLVFSGNLGGVIGDFGKVFLNGVGVNSVTGTVPESVFIVYQLTFAIITIALVSGAVAERMNFLAWILFSVFWILIVYTPLAHWVWGGGWLTKTSADQWGALDFAGGLVVHISSGVSGLVAALVLGKRDSYMKEQSLPGNIPYTVIGACLLWFGWFGFNAGSSLAANGLAGNAFLVTNTAAAVAALTWMVIEWIFHKKPSIIGAVSGLVAGLVAITPASGFVDVKAALVIGAVAAVLCYFFVAKVKKAFRYDDALDSFGIHGIGGTWGAIATGLFANPEINIGTGLFYGNPGQLLIQLVSVGAAVALAVVGTLLCLGLVRLITKLKVSVKSELTGLDMDIHGESAE